METCQDQARSALETARYLNMEHLRDHKKQQEMRGSGII